MNPPSPQPSESTNGMVDEAQVRASFVARFPGCAEGSANKESPECESGWAAWLAAAHEKAAAGVAVVDIGRDGVPVLCPASRDRCREGCTDECARRSPGVTEPAPDLLKLIERYAVEREEIAVEAQAFPGDSWKNKQPAADATLARVKAALGVKGTSEGQQ